MPIAIERERCWPIKRDWDAGENGRAFSEHIADVPIACDIQRRLVGLRLFGPRDEDERALLGARRVHSEAHDARVVLGERESRLRDLSVVYSDAHFGVVFNEEQPAVWCRTHPGHPGEIRGNLSDLIALLYRTTDARNCGDVRGAGLLAACHLRCVALHNEWF